ncbi:MAG: MMPL family transporter [Myxococcota bacterium]
MHVVTRGAFTSEQRARALARTGAAVLGATITTAFGFGALLAADHAGLNSLGALALLGLIASLFAALVWLLSLFSWLPNPSDRTDRADPRAADEPTPSSPRAARTMS